MQLGIFTRTFERPTLEETLDAVQAHGLETVQLNWESVIGGAMPAAIDDDQIAAIGQALTSRSLGLAALSGTYNMTDPDPAARRAGQRSLGELARLCPLLDTRLITLCTGTCDPDYLWRAHPDNDSPQAWNDMVGEIAQAVQTAQDHDVVLVFEPEVNNVVNTPVKARRLLDEIASPHLQVVIDGANLFHAGQLPRMSEILDEAFDLLGADIAMAHAKDLERDGDAGHQAAGTGLLDYDRYLRLLDQVGFKGALILHSLEEAQVPTSAAFVRDRLPR
ncbi:MAG: TIM barrel protein [Candidatus Latescibacteria bacterium]|nr:TIM barrel protein [Candidatus Latescibacterota bacterium]